MIREWTTHLWQSTFFAAAVALLTIAFRRNRAQVRYWLWLSASIKFLVPFALLISLGSHLGWSPLARQIATPAVTVAVEYVAQPFADSVSFAPATTVPRTEWTPVVVIALWAGGLLSIAFMRLRLWLRVRTALRGSEVLDIPAAVEVRSSAGLLEPGVVGLLRPVLMLPAGITERLTPSELEAVLAHELCHVRRRDNLFASVHMIVEAVFWFHPLVWWIGARLLEERERACDEGVLSMGNQPRVYADAIVHICRLYAESPLVCVAGVTGSDIRKRIEAIMLNRTIPGLNTAKKFLLAGAGVVALAGPIAVGVLIAVGHVPSMHAQPPTVVTPAPQMTQVAQSGQFAPRPTASAADQTATPAVANSDRRLVALLFDFSGLTMDEQVRAREAGVRYIQNNLKPADLVSVMVAGDGPVDSPIQVAQDFTSDTALLTSGIRGFNAGNAINADTTFGHQLGTIQTVSKMLRGFPEKKALVYIARPFERTGGDSQDSAAALKAALVTVTSANVAIYPIDVRGFDTVIGSTVPGGRSMTPQPGAPGDALVIHGTTSLRSAPPGVSEDEYSRRLAYVQSDFGSANSAMSRAYLRYGAPDQIENRSSTDRIWRYNYLDDFHSGAAFEFTGKGPLGARIVWPPAKATFEGQRAGADTSALLQALVRDSPGIAAGGTVTAGFPGRHSSMEIYDVSPGMAPAADRRFPSLMIPLDSLSGTIDVVAQIRTRLDTGAGGAVVANLRDSAQASAGSYQANFTVSPGAYVCNVLVREQSTGRAFGEKINFDAK